MIPIIISVRGILFASLIIGALAAFIVSNNSKEKNEYEMSTGTIKYFEKEYQNLLSRNKDDYRYLKIDTYPYLFEIYKPNSIETNKNIDDLKYGEIIDIYYYETSYTYSEAINRYVQFIDHNYNPYFIRNNFQKNLGYILIGLAFLLNVIGFIFRKMGKLDW